MRRRRRPTSSPRPEPRNALEIEVCADPETSMRLMGARGHLDQSTIGSLAIAFAQVADGVSLHLDITDTVIGDAEVVHHLERLVDYLEQRSIRLRVVGFDPGHPALSDDRLRS